MAILDRVTQIVRANINDLLNRAEDPEKMLEQIIRDMEDAVERGEAAVAEQIAQERMIQADLARAKSNATEWSGKAELAVTKGRYDLAREALNRGNDYTAQVAVYQAQYDKQHQAVEKLRQQLMQLRSKLDEARRNKDMLIARAKRARTQQEVAKISQQLSPKDLSGEYARMARKVEEEEARAVAAEEVKQVSVDEEFKKLEEGKAADTLERQLDALKAKVAAGSKPA